MTTTKRMINLDGEYHKYYKVYGLYGMIEIDYDLGIAKYTAKNDLDSFGGIWNFHFLRDEWCLQLDYVLKDCVPKTHMEIGLEIITMIEGVSEEDKE